MSERKHNRRGGVVGPLILIGLGIIFLLNNLGILDWSIWELLLRLWPILLVAAGLDLILGRRSIWGSLLALALTLAVLAVAIWLSEVGVGVERAAQIEEIVQPLDDVDRAEVIIAPGVGTLQIEALEDSENLVEGTARLGPRETLDSDFSIRGNRSALTLRTEGTSLGPSAVSWTGQRVWDLQLNGTVPLRLETDLGLGKTDLNLTGLNVESLNVEQGLGQAIVVLPQEGRFEAKIEGAIGQTVILIPESLAARIRLDTGITARDIPDEYQCGENVCTSSDYESADQRVELEVSQAIGSLVIRR